MPSVAEPPMRPMPTPAPTTASPAARPAPISPKPRPFAPDAAASCSSVSMCNMLTPSLTGDHRVCALAVQRRLSPTGPVRPPALVPTSVGTAGIIRRSADYSLSVVERSPPELLLARSFYFPASLMLYPQQSNEHRREQREHERLQKRDEQLEQHDSCCQQRSCYTNGVALEQKGQAQECQHQHVARRHVGEESNCQSERLGQLADDLDRSHHHQQEHLEERSTDPAGQPRWQVEDRLHVPLEAEAPHAGDLDDQKRDHRHRGGYRDVAGCRGAPGQEPQ